jgi:O-antigen ligase
MINKYVLIRNLAILCIVCNLLFWFFPFPPIVWRGVLIALSVIAILNKRSFLPCEKAVLFFAAFNLFHFLVSLWQTSNTSSIGNILSGLLSLSLFSFLSKKGVMQEKAITIIGLILLISSALCYYYYDNLLLNKTEMDTTTNSYSEFFLMLLPLLLFVKKPVFRWSMLLVCLFFLILGAKRGNIIAAVIPLVILLFRVFKESKRSVLTVVLTIAIVAGVSYLVYYWVSGNEYFLFRIEQTKEGNSSKRDELYYAAWHLWYDSDNLFTTIVGYGYGGTFSKLKMAAHNDWLEILVDYGLVGVFLYLLVYFRFIQQIRITNNKEAKAVLLSAISILFIKSLYSMSFNTSTLPILMISLGTALGQYNCSKIT